MGPPHASGHLMVLRNPALDPHQCELSFPRPYATAKHRWAPRELSDPRESLAPLFDLILSHVPAPEADPEGPFRVLATTLEANPYLGRLLTGRITSGRLK